MTTSPSIPLSFRPVSQPISHHDQDEPEVVTDQVREAIAVATTAPSSVLNDSAHDLPALCSVIESALACARA